MSDQAKNKAETEQEDDNVQVELFDLWERRFKFERLNRLHPIDDRDFESITVH